MCLCGGNEDLCNNINNEVILTDESDEDDEEEDNDIQFKTLNFLMTIGQCQIFQEPVVVR